MINFIIETEENDNNNKEYCNCEIAEQLQISEDINNMTGNTYTLLQKEHGQKMYVFFLNSLNFLDMPYHFLL